MRSPCYLFFCWGLLLIGHIDDLGDKAGLAIIWSMYWTVRIHWLFVFLVGLSLLFAGCGSVAEDPPTISWTPLPESVGPSSPTAVDPESKPPTPSICINNAQFLEDLTIPDGSVVAPGTMLDKRWSVQNSGSCDWGPGYNLVRLGADPLSGMDELALYPARAGTAAVWQVVLKAPMEPGDYFSRWQARTPTGSLFGDEVFLLISVELPTPTPSPEPFPTP